MDKPSMLNHSFIAVEDCNDLLRKVLEQFDPKGKNYPLGKYTV